MKKNTFHTSRNSSQWEHRRERKPLKNFSPSSRKSWYSHYQYEKTGKSENIFSKFPKISFTKIIGAFLLMFAIGFAIIWWLFLSDAPAIEWVENPNNFVESTVIYDRNNKELYSFSEKWKRTNVEYEDISQSIKDAIVSAEDQWFFENPWVDVLGLFRAGINYAIGKSSQVQGTSTLSQQLIKNTLLSNERTLKRKIQEAYLAYKLNQKYSKEDILKFYLNAIEFGHGANGIEQASLTFFGKRAKDVGPLGAAILASLPKGPTVYSPYSHRGKLMWKVEAYPADSTKNRITLSSDANNNEYAPLYGTFKKYLKNLSFQSKWNNNIEVCGLKKEYNAHPKLTPNNSGCLEVNFGDLLDVLWAIQVRWNLTIEGNTEEYIIEYTVGRKDYVASQMFRYGKIDSKTFADILYNGLEFEFNRPSQAMRYPYFVMYVKEQLESKYGKDINIKNGLKVYTTIDPNLQEEAERIIKEQVRKNQNEQWANSAALVSMDNTTGELLAMVGWPDYFDEKNGGNNNMTTALRQPGSSFKPIVYGMAISKNPIWPESPVADAQLKVGSWEVNNYDNKFNGLLSVGQALAYSRNIPAVKMYFLAGQENDIIKTTKNLGINTFDPNAWYGAPMALGTAEVRPIELMQAYSVFANNGIKRDLFAIKKIVDSGWTIIEEVNKSPTQEVFSPESAYIVNTILSNNEYRPNSPTWRKNLSISGKTVAAKTGTSNKPAKKWSNKILPGDTWTIWYSPNITTVVWAGNVDGTPLKWSCDGINCAAPAWNKFMTYALKDIPNVEFKKPKWIFTYKTSKLSGLLSNGGIENIMAVELKERDSGGREINIDSLCNWPTTDETPEDAIIKVIVPTAKPIIDRFDPEWLKWFYAAANISASSQHGQMSTQACERPRWPGSVSVNTEIVGVGNNILKINWWWDRKITKFRIISNGETIKNINFDEPATSGSDRINTSAITGSTSVSIELIDEYGFKYIFKGNTARNPNENPTEDDLTPIPSPTPNITPTLPSIQNELADIEPNISISNPSRSSISLYSGDSFNLRFTAQTGTPKKSVSVKLNWKTLLSASSEENFVVPVSSNWLEVGNHSIIISLSDANGKSTSKTISVNILPR